MVFVRDFVYVVMQIDPKRQFSALLMVKKHNPLTRSRPFIFLYYTQEVLRAQSRLYSTAAHDSLSEEAVVIIPDCESF